ncbi:MAG: UTP--glucose-1-phosphate uridylyltransferase GalU [Candidatus Peregrinibacteria bacterium]|nr:UTP--glucose-1-phosphate uridylyltransferase GalU [Candidatus Peregrinibacteria bacterium]
MSQKIPKITKAVFPAAGFGTRFLPVTKSQPKEMLPIVDKPVIQYLVEEAVDSGITEIIIVTGRGKRAIEDHFDSSWELEHNLVEKGKHNLLKDIRKISRLAKFIYVRQAEPKGDGDAILCAKEVIGNEPFAVLFGDDIIDHKTPATKQLLDIFYQKNSCVIALEKVQPEKTHLYGIVGTKQDASNTNPRLHLINSLIEKPQPAQAPSDLAIIGKYILTPEIIPALLRARPSHDSELRLIDGLLELGKTQSLYGYQVEGRHYDTGDKLGLIKATIDFALDRPDLGPELKKYLEDLFKL